MKSIYFLILGLSILNFTGCSDSRVGGEGFNNFIGLTKEGEPFIVYYSAFSVGHEGDVDKYVTLKYALMTDNGWIKEIIDNRAWKPSSFDATGNLPDGRLVEATIDRFNNPVVIYPYGEEGYLFKIAKKKSEWEIEFVPSFGDNLSREFVFVYGINHIGLTHIFYTNVYEGNNFTHELKHLYYNGESWQHEIIDQDALSIRQLILEDNKIWVLYTNDKVKIALFDLYKWELFAIPLQALPSLRVDFDSSRHLQGINITPLCGVDYTHWDSLKGEYITENIINDTNSRLIEDTDDFTGNFVQFNGDSIFLYFVCMNSGNYVNNFIYSLNETWYSDNFLSEEPICNKPLSFYLSNSNEVKFLCEQDGDLKIFSKRLDGWTEEKRTKICLSGGRLTEYSIVSDWMQNLHISFDCVKSWRKRGNFYSEYKLYYIKYNGEIINLGVVDE